MRGFVFGVLAVGVAGSVLVPACTSGGIPSGEVTFPDAGDGSAASFPGVGQPCGAGGLCRPGLTCTASVCQPGRSSEVDAACVISAECKAGLYCGPERKCAAGGAVEAGGSCNTDAECKSTLRCNLVGFGAQCAPEGTKDLGAACAGNAECFGGLLCIGAPGTASGKVCAQPPPGSGGIIALPTFAGVACKEEAATPVTAHFRVPRHVPEDEDFFRLPFPNDIRLKADGHPDLRGFPTPGPELLGFDLVDLWARDVEKNADRWSVYPTVTFRFSGELDFETLKLPGGTRWIDLENGNDIGHTWGATTGRTAYVCANGVSFRPRLGEPLTPGHAYAVIMAKGAKAKDGSAALVAPDLQALLSETPATGELAAAWAAYAPLRQLKTKKADFDITTVLNAAVFTVGRPESPAINVAAAANLAAAPTTAGSTWVKCGGGAVSPCAQRDDKRACPAAEDPRFDELHTVVKLPIFQKGTPPYLTPNDGGEIAASTGLPPKEQDLDVCLALTVPKTAVTASLPVVVYAHGTGGSFRSHINENLAGRLADKGIAMIGIDQVAHGTRRGASQEKPENLFFNFTNPGAARGNVLQGAADQISLVRLTTGITIAQGTSPTGKAINFDPAKIGFWGHSQGATEGAIALPHLSGVKAAVLTGVGASLLDSLVTKKSPVNIAGAAAAVLGESPVHVSSSHPALTVLQNGIDPSDPLVHASAIFTPAPNKHLFVPYGQRDTYAPPVTQATYILAAKLQQAQAPAGVTPDDLLGTSVGGPLAGNANGFTAGTRQYSPGAGRDGHFVGFEEGYADVERFFTGALTTASAPSIGP